MPNTQLPIAIALSVVVVASFAIFVYNRERDGNVKLPTQPDEQLEPEGHDPFDVTRPEDFEDGQPIDEDKFWLKMKWIKLFICLLMSATVILNAVALAWAGVESDTTAIAGFALYVVFGLYNLVIAGRAVGQDTQSKHSESILHIATLTVIAALLQFAAFIYPTSSKPVAVSYEDVPALRAILTATMVLYIVTAVVAMLTPLGPPLHYPPEYIYSEKTIQSTTNKDKENVTGVIGASAWNNLLFSYTTKVVMLGNVAESLEIGDLPIVPANMRATANYASMKRALKNVRLRVRSWTPRPGSGFQLGWQLFRLNSFVLGIQAALAASTATMYYLPPFFLRQLVDYLERDPERRERKWGMFYALGMFAASALAYLATAQLWSLSTTTIQVRLRIQLNSVLFQKTLVRKDVASSAPQQPKGDDANAESKEEKPDEEADFSSKAQIMNLMTTDVDRVSEFAYHLFSLIDSPIEIIIGTVFLYNLLGVSCFIGLAVTCLFLPLNHWAGKVVVGAQDNLMKARDERIALMNEILGAIRMLKFMAWERNFEARVLKIRDNELRYQKLNYVIETLWNAIWNATPMLVTLVSFWHYAVIRKQPLTPSVAFTSIIVFNELKFALSALPETFINMLQSLVSLRRIEKYLSTNDVSPVPSLEAQSQKIAFQSCTVSWPQNRSGASRSSSVASTPRVKFALIDLTLDFPVGELSLICGKLGSGKTLLLCSLLGEVDILSGQMTCPRSPPDAIAALSQVAPKEEWIVKGLCAYVPQAAWLRNASIKDNILFNLPFDEERYQKTLEVCALVTDLDILEDGDESEIGERGVNLSGGQKARVSLARAVYSRASIVLLDDVLSAVDAHTAHHLYHECLKGELMKDRTVILVSHHVRLCAGGASYIVALDNGRLSFAGDRDTFQRSGVIRTLVQSTIDEGKDKDETLAEEDDQEKIDAVESQGSEGGDSTTAASTVVVANGEKKVERKPARKLVEEEKRATGRIGKEIWTTYFKACGAGFYWSFFLGIFILAALSPVAENGWLQNWASAATRDDAKSAAFYVGVYAAVIFAGLIITTWRWYVLYSGSIHASRVLYKRLLETVLFANIRFHDTVSRGRLLNRFGKDFEGIDSNLSDHFGRSTAYALSCLTTIITVSIVGGIPFLIAIAVLLFFYYQVAKVYGQTSRDMRRLDSVTRSPLYSIYGETIAGVSIIRAFGASSKFLRDMLRCVDTNSNPYYWMWGVNRWLSVRFNLLSAAIMAVTGVVAVLNGNISASLAGFSLTFANTIMGDMLFMVRRFVGLEQSLVALERVKEYTDIQREPPEYVEPRPPASWPTSGLIKCEDLVIRYAPDLPNVLHHLNFEIRPGEKVGILGRTGSGKSTLALSFFRFVEATEGRILVDDVDIGKIGLTDLRSRLTIIPQDPTILSGSIRSTLDVFDEYEDKDIFEALRRVHLLPSVPESTTTNDDTVNANLFRSLDSPVSEGGDNFSTGEKQLLCMARAILKRSKVLVMDEATASVDYATDELIGNTIRQEFADSTILTIAHRLRTVIDYDRIMLLENGHIVEFDRPSVLLKDSNSKFHGLCKATGKDEFAMLKKMADVRGKGTYGHM